MDGDGMERTPEQIAEYEVQQLLEDSYNENVSIEEGKEMMELLDEKKEDYILLDVRTEDEFKEGHIPNAINIPNERIHDEPIGELPYKDVPIFIYCRSGNRSKQAQQNLASLGYTKLIEFGGIIDWIGEIEK
ncbi:MAG: rhodanese-like domain-containing protein [Holdemanella sp.]|nr:rhodanese-like domain-containing protein [Holdemanella sp.]